MRPDPLALTDAFPARPARVLLWDLEPAMATLLQEWLADAGLQVLAARPGAAADAPSAELVLVDVPFPRQGGGARLRELAAALPGLPILALSSSFFAGVAARGAVARELGVAGVLAKPVQRAALLAAVGELLGAAP